MHISNSFSTTLLSGYAHASTIVEAEAYPSFFDIIDDLIQDFPTVERMRICTPELQFFNKLFVSERYDNERVSKLRMVGDLWHPPLTPPLIFNFLCSKLVKTPMIFLSQLLLYQMP